MGNDAFVQDQRKARGRQPLLGQHLFLQQVSWHIEDDGCLLLNTPLPCSLLPTGTDSLAQGQQHPHRHRSPLVPAGSSEISDRQVPCLLAACSAA